MLNNLFSIQSRPELQDKHFDNSTNKLESDTSSDNMSTTSNSNSQDNETSQAAKTSMAGKIKPQLFNGISSKFNMFLEQLNIYF